MISDADIEVLRDLLSRSTSGKWSAGHLANDDHNCMCAYIFSEGHLGGIGEVYIDNGRAVGANGGNDCPVLSEAKANLALIVAMKNALPALLDEIELSRKT